MAEEKIKEILKEIVSQSFYLLISIFQIALYILVIFGAIASLILLLKMYPKTGLVLLNPMWGIYHFMKGFVKVVVTILSFGLIALFAMWMDLKIREIKERREKRYEKNRRKFLKEIVNEINKGKKKSGRRRRH